MSEKIYRVQMNSKGMPNFATAEEIPQGECKWRKACKVFSQQQITNDSFCSWGERKSNE